jgi:hypothetical protein
MEGGNHEEDVYEQGERQEEPTQIQAWHTRSGTLKSGSPPEPRFSGLAAADISMLSMSSSPGTVLNHGSPSTKQ